MGKQYAKKMKIMKLHWDRKSFERIEKILFYSVVGFYLSNEIVYNEK
jgi:hypothetical protein